MFDILGGNASNIRPTEKSVEFFFDSSDIPVGILQSAMTNVCFGWTLSVVRRRRPRELLAGIQWRYIGFGLTCNKSFKPDQNQPRPSALPAGVTRGTPLDPRQKLAGMTGCLVFSGEMLRSFDPQKSQLNQNSETTLNKQPTSLFGKTNRRDRW